MIQKASRVSNLENRVETPEQLFARITTEFTTPLNGTQRRFADINMPISEAQYQHAAQTFIDFLTLPFTTKDKFHAFYNPAEPKSHYGYEVKSRQPVIENGSIVHSGGNKDNKEFFHYGEVVPRDLGHLRGIDSRVDTFFDAAHGIYLPVREATRQFAQALDTKIPGTLANWFPEDKVPQIYLRFLAYRPINEGDPLANDHYDQAAATFALWESKEGLYIGQGMSKEEPNLARIVNPVKHRPGHAILFPSAAIDQVVPPELLSKFPKGYHGVDHKGGKDSFEGTPRFAIVAFIWPAIGKFSSYDTVHPDPNRSFTEGEAASTKRGY